MATQTVTSNQEIISVVSFPDGSSPFERQVGLMTPIQRQRLRDRTRTALQAPISQTKLCVMYLVNRRERRSPWFYTEDRARKALELMQAKHGARNCILYRD